MRAVGIMLVQRVLNRVFPDHLVRCQLPLGVSEFSEPEPDFAIVPGQPRDYLGKPHPNSSLLVIEIADTTLAFDRKVKAKLYAAAGIADYWLLNLVDIAKTPRAWQSPQMPHSAIHPSGHVCG